MAEGLQSIVNPTMPVGAASETVAPAPSKTRTRHADTTDLALGRTYLASERTLMGWIRTALSMISFGFTIGKLGQVLEHVHVKGLLRLRTFSIDGLANLLVALGTVSLAVATVQHWRRMRSLSAVGLGRQRSLGLVVAIVLTLLGAFALTSLVAAL
jgi:putative membrane protein